MNYFCQLNRRMLMNVAAANSNILVVLQVFKNGIRLGKKTLMLLLYDFVVLNGAKERLYLFNLCQL